METKVLKLGTTVHDTVTGTNGMLTHMIVEMDGKREYIYQPSGLNPKSGQPVEKTWLAEARIKGGIWVNLDIPMDILNTKAKDIASGFKGTITKLVYHLNHCLHIGIKPKGIVEGTGATINECEFDIRRCKGPAIDKMGEFKVKQPPSPSLTIPRTQR